MVANITITITGADRTADYFKRLETELKNTTVPLANSSKKYLNVISGNFTDEGVTFGKKWAPLSPATIRIKSALKKEGKSIGVKKPLLRTGLLRKSFGFALSSLNSSRIFNKQAYAEFHQEGGTANFNGRTVEVPKRILTAVDTARVKMVAKTFEVWLRGIINKK